jgi:hypothetical protein
VTAPSAAPGPDPAVAPGTAAAATAADPATAPVAGPQPVPDPPERTRTGHPAVDAALGALGEAAAAPPDGQVAAFQAAHRTLRETLATIDDA